MEQRKIDNVETVLGAEGGFQAAGAFSRNAP
jgi:hypothetical protein